MVYRVDTIKVSLLVVDTFSSVDGRPSVGWKLINFRVLLPGNRNNKKTFFVNISANTKSL